MEGKATFTLAEAKTGKVVRSFTEHNLVTDAVQRILKPPHYAVLNDFSYSSFLNGALPLSVTLFAGIMLLGNELEESRDNVMPDGGIIPIATAGEAYAGTNPRRGSLNINESYVTENGYHYTWDFGTDKANGTIKCAALTSRHFGNSGFSNEGNNSMLYMNPMAISAPIVSPGVMFANCWGQYVGTFQDRVHTYVRHDNATGLYFTKVRSLDPDSVSVNDSANLSAKQEPISTTVVYLPFTLYYAAKSFMDHRDKVRYYFSRCANRDGQYYIDYAGVKMTDLTLAVSGSWKVAMNYELWACAVYDGKLWVLSARGIDEYSANGELLNNYPISSNFGGYFFEYNGIFAMSTNSFIYSMYNGEFCPTYMNNNLMMMYSCDIQAPYFPFCALGYSNSIYDSASMNPYLGIASNYFATINNLSEPLEKTNQHTLKITYDITN